MLLQPEASVHAVFAEAFNVAGWIVTLAIRSQDGSEAVFAGSINGVNWLSDIMHLSSSDSGRDIQCG